MSKEISQQEKAYLCWETVVSMWALHKVRIAMCMLARTMHAMRVSSTCRHCRAVHVTSAISCGYNEVTNNVDNILKYIRRSESETWFSQVYKKI